MEIGESRLGKFIVLRPVGRLDNATSAEFQARLLQTVNAGAGDVIVDLAAVAYISSGGLRALMMAAKQKPANRRIAVAALHPVVREIFAIARFHHGVPVFGSIDEAALAWDEPSQPEKARVTGTAAEDGPRSRPS